MGKKRKVLIAPGHVAHYREPFYRLLSDYCATADIEITVAASRSLPSNLLAVQSTGITDVPMKQLGPFVWQNTLRESSGCDLVIAQQEAKYLANYFLQLKRLVSPQKFAFWGHGKNFQTNTSSLAAEYTKQMTALWCDWWFAYNDQSAQIVEELGYPRQRITSVVNSIDTSHLAAIREALKPEDISSVRASTGIRSNNIAVFTGGLYEQKRLRFLIDACSLVRQSIPDFELIVIGSGPQSSYIELCCRRHRWIHYVGPKTDTEKVPYWAIAKVLLMPGLVGLVVLDSFALGVPIITTNFPEHSPEISYLQDGVNGIVCRPWASVEAYAHGILAVLLSPSLQATLAANARQSATNYTIERMARNFFEGIVGALTAPKLRLSRIARPSPATLIHNKNQLAIISRSLSPYTRNFYDELAKARNPDETGLIIGRRESDWINPWDENLLAPQFADHFYAQAGTTKRGRQLLLPSRSLVASLERLQPRLVAIQECSAYCVCAALWAVLRRIPYVFVTEVGASFGAPYPELGRSQRFLHWLVLRLARGVIALSPDAQKRAERSRKACVLAPHAIDTLRYRPGGAPQHSHAPVVLMTAGNFIYRKGYDLLIKALALVQQKLAAEHQWVMRCYGAGGSGELRALARSAGIADLVEFHSFLDEGELVRAYQSADAFVFPSRKETYGIVLHEAAACGLPLVASIHAGATELLAREGENAFRVDPENTAQFASALEAIICDSELRQKFGVRSRSLAETWDVKRNAERTKLWIETLLI